MLGPTEFALPAFRAQSAADARKHFFRYWRAKGIFRSTLSEADQRDFDNECARYVDACSSLYAPGDRADQARLL